MTHRCSRDEQYRGLVPFGPLSLNHGRYVWVNLFRCPLVPSTGWLSAETVEALEQGNIPNERLVGDNDSRAGIVTTSTSMTRAQ